MVHLVFWNGLNINKANVMVILYFTFFKFLKYLEINTTIRVSIWLDGNESYLMPSQFREVVKNNDYYSIKVVAIDPGVFISKKYLNKKFLFGHPGKIIGYGVLKRIEGLQEDRIKAD